MKTTFDLPEPLLRRAKAVAALRGSSLRDLVAEAMEAKLADEAAQTASPSLRDWEAFKATLVLQSDGTYRHPGGIEHESLFEVLEAMRRPAGPTGSFSDGRAALRAALVRQPEGGYVNLLGYDGPSFDDALAAARSAMRGPEPTDFGTSDDADAASA